MNSAEIRRARILEFIIDYKRGHDGCSPTIRQIMNSCAISSTSVVLYHLRTIEKQGKIRRGTDRRKLNIEVIGGKWSYEPWTAVEDGLPEGFSHVFVVCKNGRKFSAFHHKDGNFLPHVILPNNYREPMRVVSSHWKDHELPVTHWMPLPDLPELEK